MNRARGSRDKKAALLRHLRAGRSVADSCRMLEISASTYHYYRRTDGAFLAAAAEALGNPLPEVDRPPVPDFPEFCERYLGIRLFSHQLQWFDVLEGRRPRDLHPSQVFDENDPDLVIVNTPPGHAKSSTITVAYTTWRIVKDPAVRVVLVSKTQRLAIQFLLTVKTYLTHPNYELLQLHFGPPQGYAANSAAWKQDMIYVSNHARDTQEKDPTVQALGIGGQLYGARADLVVLDDCVDNLNAADHDKQVHWVQTEVISRIPDGGKVLVVGTRMAANDLYLELRNPARYALDDEGGSPWTYLSQPAVLEWHEDPERWVTLWPRCDRPSGRHVRPDKDGLYEKWSGPVLAKRRRRMTPSAWARVYQQEQVTEDTVFRPDDIRRAVAGYSAGLLVDNGVPGVMTPGRAGGMQGLRLVAGLDPASVGCTAAVLIGYDPADGVRWVIDAHNQPSMPPHEMKRLLREWTVKYGIHEWRVERNAFQGFLTRDAELKGWLAAHGCVLGEHWTGSNKADPGLGVAAMSSLFEAGLVRLPRLGQKAAVQQLADQLGYWSADLHKSVKTDLVMALWFAMLRIDELSRLAGRQQLFDRRKDIYLGGYELSSRRIISGLDMDFAPEASMWGGA